MTAPLTRREFTKSTVAVTAAAALTSPLDLLAQAANKASREAEKAYVLAHVPSLHAETVKRLQEWIALPSIAAENRNYPQGPEHMAALARDAGFTNVEIIPTS